MKPFLKSVEFFQAVWSIYFSFFKFILFKYCMTPRANKVVAITETNIYWRFKYKQLFQGGLSNLKIKTTKPRVVWFWEGNGDVLHRAPSRKGDPRCQVLSANLLWQSAPAETASAIDHRRPSHPRICLSRGGPNLTTDWKGVYRPAILANAEPLWLAISVPALVLTSPFTQSSSLAFHRCWFQGWFSTVITHTGLCLRAGLLESAVCDEH